MLVLVDESGATARTWAVDLSLQDQDLMAKGEDPGITLVTGHDQQPEQVRYER